MNPQFLKEREELGALYGLVAGVSFAFFTWALDAFVLAGSHAAHPFLKLFSGLLITLPLFVLAGWLTAKWDNHALAVILWMALCLWVFYASVLVQYVFLPRWYALMGSPVASLTQPGMPSYFFTLLLTVGAFINGIVFFLIGLLEINLLYGILSSSAKASKLFVGMVLVLLMVMAGYQIDTFLYRNARGAVRSFDKLIAYINSPEGQALDAKTKNLKNFGAVASLGEENLKLPRRFYVIEASIGEFPRVQLILQLGGIWVNCYSYNFGASFCSPYTFK
ncbi:MAG: hypothetical protein VB108_07920 [Anaerolineaceae bacterium]|nr:hypothetical protein [Anaerolineaceae bacterium]